MRHAKRRNLNSKTAEPDWEAEAKRMARAFGAGEIGEFRTTGLEGLPGADLRIPAFEPRVLFLKRDGIQLRVIYGESSINFTLLKDEPDADAEIWYLRSYDSSILVTHDRKQFHIYSVDKYGRELARLLFHLDLLAPEAEVPLGVCSHDKLEWSVEREERLKVPPEDSGTRV